MFCPLLSSREYPWRQLLKKETSARFLGQPSVSGGQPGRACPVFSACWPGARKSVLLQLERLSRDLETVSGLCAFKRLIFPKPVFGVLVKIQWVCVLSGISTFPKPQLG